MKNVVSVAQNTQDVEIFIYTSSGSIPIQRTNFWIPPWKKHPTSFVQVIGDEYLAEMIAVEAHDPGKGFRTGCLTPGSPIYAPMVGRRLMRLSLQRVRIFLISTFQTRRMKTTCIG